MKKYRAITTAPLVFGINKKTLQIYEIRRLHHGEIVFGNLVTRTLKQGNGSGTIPVVMLGMNEYVIPNTLQEVGLGADYSSSDGMGRYIFNTNFDWISPPPACAKSNPPCSYMPRRKSFKKGEVIEGNLITNTQTSEPPNFIETSEGVRIDYGGRSGILAPFNSGVVPPPAKGATSRDGLEMGLYRLGIGIGGIVGAGAGLFIAKKNEKNLLLGALIGGVTLAGGVILYNTKFGYKFGKIVL